MRYYADLHVHSKYSRATSSDCDLEHLAFWARKKGITVIGTGDFTHPAWREELKEKLVPAEPGLFRLRKEVERAVGERLAPSLRGEVRFLLSVEISTIYKKGDRTRKIHHLVYASDFEAVDKLVRSLSRIGNLHSDGRPILGLDSRHLLELVLESGEGSYLVPAHIWTPWFSVLGSKAGFDAVDECYGDLARHVFALETGLSSDPAMNWRLSALDRYRLVSNSDAHSPPKLGREASAFDGDLDYFALRRALETGRGFAGTVEFFPEEGKYHLDGHRKCGVRLEPAETRRASEACPVCGQPVTVGVLHRVEELADRPEGARPEGASPFKNLVPLPEVLAELAGTGATSKAVQHEYEGLLARLGPELGILEETPVEELARAGSSQLAEALRRMRENRVIRDAGYDGEYGTIRLFSADELRRGATARWLFEPEVAEAVAPNTEPPATPAPAAAVSAKTPAPISSNSGAGVFSKIELPSPDLFGSPILGALDPDQRAAAEITDGPLLIIAGPGTGKTRTLTHRIAHLVADRGVAPEACLAITFTRRAAGELRERLTALLPRGGDRVPTMTFHALGLSILREHGHLVGLPTDFAVAGGRETAGWLAEALAIPPRKAEKLLAEISRLKRTLAEPEPGGELARASSTYARILRDRSAVDLDDLVGLSVSLLDSRPDLVAALRERHRYLSVDEYQDVDERQYRLVRLLSPPDGNLCAIGDPDQAIYGFRGADVRFFLRFREDFPTAKAVRISRNYRSGRTILDGSLQVIARSSGVEERRLQALLDDTGRIVIHEAPSERAEAELVVHTVERMIGGSSFFSLDSGRVAAGEVAGGHGFSDFAVLYRTEAQSDALAEALSRSGMPFQRRSHRRLSDHPAVAEVARALRDGGFSLSLAGLKEAAARVREEVARPPDAAAVAPGEEADPALREADVDEAVELLRPFVERHGRDRDRLFTELALDAGVDTWDPRADRISLLTLHAAKGLEFRVVFIVGCEDGIVPLRFRHDDADLDEERRLFYVGMTRARERLFLTHARRRLRHGRPVESSLSPFVRDIEERLLERQRSEPSKKAPPREPDQLKLF